MHITYTVDKTLINEPRRFGCIFRCYVTLDTSDVLYSIIQDLFVSKISSITLFDSHAMEMNTENRNWYFSFFSMWKTILVDVASMRTGHEMTQHINFLSHHDIFQITWRYLNVLICVVINISVIMSTGLDWWLVNINKNSIKLRWFMI